MKTSLYLVVVALFVTLFSCSSKEQKKLDSFEWELIKMTVDGKSVDLSEVPPTLYFSDSARVSGFLGCNRFFGTYEMKDNTLKLNISGTTMMSCPDLNFESDYLKVLTGVNTYDIKDKQLHLMDSNKNELIYKESPFHDDSNK